MSVTARPRRVNGAILAGLLLGGHGGVRAEPAPKSLLKIARMAPGEVQGAFYLRTTPDTLDWILGVLPFGKQYREVLEERSARFAGRTGINPMEDVKGLAGVFSRTDASAKPSHAIFFLELTKHPRGLAKALAADPELKKRVTFESAYKGHVGETRFRFVSGGVLFGPSRSMNSLRKKGDFGKSDLPARAAATVTAPYRVMSAWAKPKPKPLAGKAPPDASKPLTLMTAFSQLRKGAMGMDSESLNFRAAFQTPEAAEVIRAKIADGIDAAVKGLQPASDPSDGAEPTLSQLMDPQKIAAEASRRWSKRLLSGLTIEAKGRSVALSVRGDIVRSPGAFMSVPMIGVVAAIAVPNFRAARQRANRRACFANQKTLAGATEMYNLDNNTDVKELTPKLLESLKSEGYLRSIPQDPGKGEGSSDHYYLLQGKKDVIACKVHGSISGDIPGEAPPPPPAPKSPMGGAAPTLTGMIKRFLPGGSPAAMGPGSMSVSGSMSLGGKISPGGGGAPSPGLQRAIEKRNKRACFANQKTIAGAIEMYNLDFRTAVKTLDRAQMEELIDKGYMRSLPQDPGQGADSSENYYFTDASRNGVACKVHGNFSGSVPAR